jgi:PAS domain S-box-containing protein
MEHHRNPQCHDIRVLVAEMLPLGALVVDSDERVQWANAEVARLLGYTQDELVGSHLLRLLDANSLSDSRRDVGSAEVTLGGRTFTRVQARRKDGSSILVDLTATPLDYQGIQLTCLAVRDATATNKMEVDYEAFHRQINVINRLEAAQFLTGSILHDFNNILTAIYGHAGRALEATESSEVRESLESVLQASGRATKLIARLRGPRRSDPACGPTAEDSTQFVTVTHEALGLLRGAIPQRIRMEWFLHPSTPTVPATETDLHQLVMNLGMNAAEAMSAQGGLLRVTLEPESAPNPDKSTAYAKLCVSDTGHGMDSATLERAFEPFFSTKTREDSGGLGLSVVRQLVERLGGTISVETAPGRGTAFCVRLPANADPP